MHEINGGEKFYFATNLISPGIKYDKIGGVKTGSRSKSTGSKTPVTYANKTSVTFFFLFFSLYSVHQESRLL